MSINMEENKIVFIGAGNLATNLAKAFCDKHIKIDQIYSRTELSAKTLADAVEADYTTTLEDIVNDADIYIVSLKDDALTELMPKIIVGKEKALMAHTSGSLPLDIWPDSIKRKGVFYPLQTFSKQRIVDFRNIHTFVESNNPADLNLLKQLAGCVTDEVTELSSEKRRQIHLAAVFACNFTNHMYALAEKLLKKYDLPFDYMLPLIEETERKAHVLSPKEAQTGPAVRYDERIINKHLDLLADEPEMQQIYQLISKSIHKL
ncbi:Rossmann-like and DUF2520 domain-containing protein [uncultured Bacteroides sp.]|uniref:Rossmann-like and DUF2520 domain-containing protein n=1 Tax=uncultured Bacteroides sp. TaxID=162156 RepID=UPI002AA74D97|nr:Rossmann-like and DUF2520 domain-containing protein [uncultured Bacteroides sp.]